MDNFFQKRVKTKQIIALLPAFVIIGKIVRWTIMKKTLIDLSKGWSYPDLIVNSNWSWKFFGLDEIVDGNIGEGDNVISFFKALWNFWLRIPKSFYEFEIALTITLTIVFFFLLSNVKKKISILNACFIALGIIINSVYCFSLGKEPYQLLFFLLVFFALNTEKISDERKYAFTIIILLLSAACFRTYYILIVYFAILLKLLLFKNKNLNYRNIIKIFTVMIIAYLVLMGFLYVGNRPLYIRFMDALLNASDATSNSNTYMNNLIVRGKSANPVILSLEYALATLRYMIPIELILKGPKYWLFCFYQIIILIYIFSSLKNYKKISESSRVALIVFIAFVFASGAFEVDFGAWIRHEAVLFPVLLIAIGAVNGKDKSLLFKF